MYNCFRFINTGWKNWLHYLSKASNISWFDLLVLTLMFIGGIFYLHNALYWGVAWIGDSQYGDAEFWWNGALHISQGLFQDNPGNGFRPGYFFLTGLTIPVLGQQFLQFYPYFLISFLAISGLFYLVLRPLLGRFIGACVIGTLIFNPFTAEWLATSTTDATGMMLNLLALTCLLFGVHKKLNRNWLIAFGVLFSLATLTRPLVTPFIGLVLLSIVCFSQELLKKRIIIVSWILLAFCGPTLLWMSFQKLTIDRWSISSNDASAFYAASEPNVQVWNSTMDEHIGQIAANKFHIKRSAVTDQMINQIYWQETIKNYIKYPKYHLKRALPHLLRIASFSPELSIKGTNRWRIILYEVMIASLSVWLCLQRRYFHAFFFIILGGYLYFVPKLITIMVLIGALLGLINVRKPNQFGMFFLSAYWLTGVLSLYLVGGTWGPPSFSPQFAINALGYRLGTQVFFIGDILAAYFLICLVQFKFNTKAQDYQDSSNLISAPSPLASNIVVAGYGLFILTTVIIYLIGGSIVAYRAYVYAYPSRFKTYPSLSAIVNTYQQRTGRKAFIVEGKNGGIDPKIVSRSHEMVFTGTVSPFIWNMPGQERSQMMVFTQKTVHPYTMGPSRIFLDVPQRLNAAQWVGKQGAFIISNIPDEHNKSHQPYYLTLPALRAFVPLASNEDNFAISKTTWFPLVKNATQLETSGELNISSSKVIWGLDSGTSPFQRRFFMVPRQLKNLTYGKITLHLDISAAHGPTTLSFSYTLDNTLEKSPPQPTQQTYYDILISTESNASMDSRHLLLSSNNPIPLPGTIDNQRNINVSIPNNTTTVEIIFNHLTVGTGIWMYEFNLTAADFMNLPKKPLKFRI